MSATSIKVAAPKSGAARRGHHPGLALAIIAASQLMVVLDATIVNIALPHIQTALKFSTTNLTWVLNAYTLTFGGLLLLGGRAGDILGRRSTFVFGIGLFTFASFLGGLATASWWLLAARALQGVGGAIVAPTALSLITTNFEEGEERNRAFGVFAAVSGSGAAIGLLAGGMLTSWLSWRWVLFVNIPIGIAIAIIAPLYINESQRHPGRFDVGGAISSTLGMTALVYGFIRAASEGWRDGGAIVSFAVALILLMIFLFIEMGSLQPITPLHMFANRNRSGSYVVMLALSGALFSMFFFLTLFVQEILTYSPLKAGFAFLPVSAGIVVSASCTDGSNGWPIGFTTSSPCPASDLRSFFSTMSAPCTTVAASTVDGSTCANRPRSSSASSRWRPSSRSRAGKGARSAASSSSATPRRSRSSPSPSCSIHFTATRRRTETSSIRSWTRP